MTASTRGSAEQRSAATCSYVFAVAPSRACRRGSRRSPRPAAAARSALARLGRELRQLEPGGLAGVGAEDPEAAGVGEHRDAPAPRQRLRREQRGDVDQLLERRRADARRPGGRARRLPRPSRRAPRCASSRRARPRASCAALDARASACGARPAARAARTCAGCRTTRGRAARRGVLVVLPALEQVVRRDVGLVPDRDERRRGRGPRGSAASSSARPSAPLCDEKPIVPGRQRRAAKVAFRRGAADGDAEAVRADEPRAVRAHEPRAAAPGARAPAGPISAKPAEMTHERADARAQRLLGGVEHALGRDGDHGQVDRRRGSRRPTCTPRTPATGSRAAVDRVGGAAEVRPRGCSGRARRRSSRVAREAPITATVRGSKNGRSDATTAAWSRSSTCSR